ncbi:hypothetical protein BJ742DRAFT_744653 [Cladochytrium replicatum]|nr:hypothetical protein BJ742DRAFT_744653 [Cladochytrium replicatum]
MGSNTTHEATPLRPMGDPAALLEIELKFKRLQLAQTLSQGVALSLWAAEKDNLLLQRFVQGPPPAKSQHLQPHQQHPQIHRRQQHPSKDQTLGEELSVLDVFANHMICELLEKKRREYKQQWRRDVLERSARIKHHMRSQIRTAPSTTKPDKTAQRKVDGNQQLPPPLTILPPLPESAAPPRPHSAASIVQRRNPSVEVSQSLSNHDHQGDEKLNLLASILTNHVSPHHIHYDPAPSQPKPATVSRPPFGRASRRESHMVKIRSMPVLASLSLNIGLSDRATDCWNESAEGEISHVRLSQKVERMVDAVIRNKRAAQKMVQSFEKASSADHRLSLLDPEPTSTSGGIFDTAPNNTGVEITVTDNSMGPFQPPVPIAKSSLQFLSRSADSLRSSLVCEPPPRALSIDSSWPPVATRRQQAKI